MQELSQDWHEIYLYIYLKRSFAVHESILTCPFVSGYTIYMHEQILVNILKKYKPWQVDTYAFQEKALVLPTPRD